MDYNYYSYDYCRALFSRPLSLDAHRGYVPVVLHIFEDYWMTFLYNAAVISCVEALYGDS